MSVLFPDNETRTDVVEIDGLPVNPDVAFSNKKGVYKKGIEKRQRKFLAKVSFLKPFLEPGETILIATTGCSPMSIVEQFLTGYMVFYLKQSMFVFTDRRIFHIPTASGYKYRYSLAQIRYEDCAGVSQGGHVLKVRYNTGKREQFFRIPARERGKIKSMAGSFLLGESRGERRFLCPRCATELVSKHYECPGCTLAFKTRKEATKLSWIFPGGGYFYARLHLMGVLDAVTETFLIGLIIFGIAGMVGGEETAAGLIYVGFLLVAEKLMTVFHSTHFIDEFLVKEISDVGKVSPVGMAHNKGLAD